MIWLFLEKSVILRCVKRVVDTTGAAICPHSGSAVEHLTQAAVMNNTQPGHPLCLHSPILPAAAAPPRPRPRPPSGVFNCNWADGLLFAVLNVWAADPDQTFSQFIITGFTNNAKLHITVLFPVTRLNPDTCEYFNLKFVKYYTK